MAACMAELRNFIEVSQMNLNYNPKLSHVLWMCGSPCAGKSTWADVLAERYGLAVYHVDAEFPRHTQHITQEKHPTLYFEMHTSWDQIWMQPQDVLIEQAIDCYTEHFSLILEDLLATDPTVPLLAEGTALLPGLVAPLVARPQRALCVVPTEQFQRELYAQRDFIHHILKDCRDPDQAFKNWMDRDVAFARWAAGEARKNGMRVIVNDGSRTVEDNVTWVAEYFKLMRDA